VPTFKSWNDSSPLICGTAISGDCLTGRQILLARISERKCLNILRIYLKWTTSIRVSTYGFNTKVLHHITVVKCVSWCPKIILDAGLVVNVMLEFPGQHAHLTSIFSSYFFLWGYLKTEVYASTVYTRLVLWRRIQHFASEIKNIHPESSKDLRVAFVRTIELCAREHGGNFAHILWENKNTVKNSSFVCIFLVHNPINLGSIEHIAMEFENRIFITTFVFILMPRHHPVNICHVITRSLYSVEQQNDYWMTDSKDSDGSGRGPVQLQEKSVRIPVFQPRLEPSTSCISV
jgi:hypothetical protein